MRNLAVKPFNAPAHIGIGSGFQSARNNKSRPIIRAIMVTTLTGSAAYKGASHHLGNADDTTLLQTLRHHSDAIVVGSSTVEKENYGPATSPDGTTPPPLAIVSRSLQLDPAWKVFQPSPTPPIILSPTASLQAPHNAAVIAKLSQRGIRFRATSAGKAEHIVAALAREGFTNIVVEGGPSLLGQFIAADLIDHFFLTLDPTLTATVELPMVKMTDGQDYSPLHMRPGSIQISIDGTLFLRYDRQ